MKIMDNIKKIIEQELKSVDKELGKAVKTMQDKGYKVEMKKAMNDKRMSLNKLFIYS